MKNILLVLTVLVLTLPLFRDATAENASGIKKLAPEPIHPREEQLIAMLLSRSHYAHKEIDDSVSVKMYNEYIDLLDGNKIYFLQSDIDSFSVYRMELDNDLMLGRLGPAYRIFNRFMQRFHQRMVFVQQRLDRPFDFTKDEVYVFDRRNLPWAASKAQLDSIWRKRLKNEALKLKLTGKKWDEIVKTLKKRYKNIEDRVNKTQSEDVFQYFMNALAETFDPHTAYMSPKLSDDFKIRMSHSLEGIGAVLQMEDDYTKVISIVAGGPADKAGELHPNDRIAGVGQGATGELVDVIGWRIDDVVQLIRGPKGTTVRLQVIPAEASLETPPDTISIVRDKVRLKDRAAKSDTLNFTENGRTYKIGVIDVPDFYLDYEAMRKGDPDYASTTKDVKRLLGELQSAGVEGIIIDLRNNGGGFLTEAINLTGLFIERGPVVQVRQASGRVEVDRDEDPSVTYSGPLAVMVNQFSASASEIFAAAIQDYRRGIILGTQSFGKGTVQNIVHLDRFLRKTTAKLGQVKMTIAKFYRINGGSTQNVGVIPEIVFPSAYGSDEVGERNMPNALKWDEIRPLSYPQYNNWNDALIKQLRLNHLARIHQNLRFKYYLEDLDRIRQERKKKNISLNEEKRKAQRKIAEDIKEAHKKALKAAGQADDKSDLFLTEAAHIVDDWIQLESMR